MAENFNKGWRPHVAIACTHNVMVRFDDLEWDSFIGMMEKANQDVKTTFIKQLVFSRPFRVLKIDRSLAVVCAKLSEFFAKFRTVGVNYDLVVKELKSGFIINDIKQRQGDFRTNNQSNFFNASTSGRASRNFSGISSLRRYVATPIGLA